MEHGRAIRLKAETVGLETVCGKCTAATIPEGAIVEILNEQTGARMVFVRYRERLISVFSVDLEARGESVHSANG